MKFSRITERALGTRERYVEFERASYGREWTVEELALGLVGDVGDLAKIVQAREGVRKIDADVGEALAHELSDVLWSVIVIADRCGIDLEESFVRTMDKLDRALDDATADS